MTSMHGATMNVKNNFTICYRSISARLWDENKAMSVKVCYWPIFSGNKFTLIKCNDFAIFYP